MCRLVSLFLFLLSYLRPSEGYHGTHSNLFWIFELGRVVAWTTTNLAFWARRGTSIQSRRRNWGLMFSGMCSTPCFALLTHSLTHSISYPLSSHPISYPPLSDRSIPIPEGLAPLSPRSLDTNLTRLIERYTLNGVHVLVHCRGGVGRAGLIACCWMLRLGLCGWLGAGAGVTNANGGGVGGIGGKRGRGPTGNTLTTTPTSTSQSSMDVDAPSPPTLDAPTPTIAPTTTTTTTDINETWSDKLRQQGVRKDALRLVERVISVVRRRRSLKAVETYEQVKFLVAYVEFMREGMGREARK